MLSHWVQIVKENTIDPITIGLALASQFAPSIIKYFTNSDTAGAVAGQVIDIAKTVTGKGTPDEANAAMRADPALAMQFKTAIMAHDLELAKLALAETQAYLDDRQDARSRDTELHKSGFKNDRATWMIIGDVIGMLSCLAGMIYITYLGIHAPDGQDANPLIMALNGPLGMLTQQFANGLRDAHQFEFGSSRGSEQKNELLARAPSIK